MSVSSFFKGLITKEAIPAATQRSTYCIAEPPGFELSRNKKLYYHYLFESSNEVELNVPQKLVIELVVNNLRKKEMRMQSVPRLPSVIPKLLRSLRDPKSSAQDYVDIINKDPVMSAAVIKLANSVYFNPLGKHIDDIEFAVVKLGIQGLRSVLSAAVMQPIIQRESPYFNQTGQRLWTHSLNCAVACEVIGHARDMDRYKVYLMGLIHDIGKITLFSELCKQFKLNGAAESPGHSAFAPPMKKLSAHLSYLIAKDWDLPDDICHALQQQVGLNETRELDAYSHLLYQANLATEAYAITPRSKRDTLKPVINALNLPTDLWDTLDKVSTQL